MDYVIIDGKRFNGDEKKRSKLIWVPNEKYLYSKKTQRGENVEFCCYQSVLADPKKKVWIEITFPIKFL